MSMAENVQVDFELGRDGDEASWDLPTWGHAASLIAFPLLISLEEKLFPIGTAFNISNNVFVAITASHNVWEGVKHHKFANRVLNFDDPPSSCAIDDVDFYFLHQWQDTEAAKIQIALLPLEGYIGTPPSDVGICRPKFNHGTK